jgi:nucleoid-associated protein YgaU
LVAKTPASAVSRSAQREAAETAPDASANSGAAQSAGEAQTSGNSGAVTTVTAPRNVQVKDGETLWEIAIRYLGSSARFDQLIHANPQLNNVNQIYPGEMVHLPPNPSVASR